MLLGEIVGLARASSRRGPGVARLPARKPRASGLHGISADALGAAERDHLALLLAIDQVVVVLHRDEARQAAAFGRRAASCANCQAYMRRGADVAAPCRRAPRRSAPRASPRSASRGRSGGSGRDRRSRCRAASGWRRSRAGCACATGRARSGSSPIGLKHLGGDHHLARAGREVASARGREPPR